MYDTIIIGNHLQFDHVKESLVYWFVLLMKRTSHPNASELDAKHWLALGYNQILFIGFARAGWYRLIPKYSKHSKYSKKKWKKTGDYVWSFSCRHKARPSMNLWRHIKTAARTHFWSRLMRLILHGRKNCGQTKPSSCQIRSCHWVSFRYSMLFLLTYFQTMPLPLEKICSFGFIRIASENSKPNHNLKPQTQNHSGPRKKVRRPEPSWSRNLRTTPLWWCYQLVHLLIVISIVF